MQSHFIFRLSWRRGNELFLIDINRRRPARIPEEEYEAYGCKGDIEDSIPMNEPEKLIEPEYVKEFYIRHSDIDFNRHVNNSRYVEWALEAVPEKITEEFSLEEIRIVFMREITYGHMVKTMCSVQEQESGKIKVIHLIKDDEGNNITALTTIWKADKASL
ncbi:MAG: thioesterase family protein [Clostridiaceae bacterium]